MSKMGFMFVYGLLILIFSMDKKIKSC